MSERANGKSNDDDELLASLELKLDGIRGVFFSFFSFKLFSAVS